MTLVVDASVAIRLCSSNKWIGELGKQDLTAPPLLWSEFYSALHRTVWRKGISAAQAERTLDRFASSPIARKSPKDLYDEAWRVADELGWAKTYDAEYVALARLMDCRLVTLDGRLRRATDRLGFVVAPGEL